MLINTDDPGAASLDACFRLISTKARLTSINLKCLQCDFCLQFQLSKFMIKMNIQVYRSWNRN